MKVKNISSLLFMVLLACFSRLHCGRPDPLSANGAAILDLRLSFAGKKVSGSKPELGKTGGPVSAAPVITKLVFRVLDAAGQVIVPIDSIIIAPGDRRPRKDLLVPAGTERVLEIAAFENLDINQDQRFEEVRTFFVRQTDLTIPRDDTVRIAITLFPLPVQNFRVVLAVGAGMGTPGTPGNPVAISLANHDNLRGLQFDLLYAGSLLKADTLSGVARLARFSNVTARNLTGPSPPRQAYRVIIFDQGRPVNEITPSAPGNVPESILTVLFSVEPQAANARQDTLRIVSAAATDASLKNFEVYAVEGIFTVK